MARQAIAPFLKTLALPFEMPRQSFQRIPLPGDLSSDASLAEVEEALRPYLLEDRLVRINGGTPQPVFAAILIPEGFGPNDDAVSGTILEPEPDRSGLGDGNYDGAGHRLCAAKRLLNMDFHRNY